MKKYPTHEKIAIRKMHNYIQDKITPCTQQMTKITNTNECELVAGT